MVEFLVLGSLEAWRGGCALSLGGARLRAVLGLLLLLFFFDVEDGIRDGHVTGVQTCALPISGPHSRGVHALWFVDGEFIHMASGAADFEPRHPNDDQCYRIVDVRNPSRPVEVGRWWMPGTREGDSEPAPQRLEAKFDSGFRAHNTNVFPRRPDRAYVGYIDGGAVILDIADKAHPKLVANWRNSPPFN